MKNGTVVNTSMIWTKHCKTTTVDNLLIIAGATKPLRFIAYRFKKNSHWNWNEVVQKEFKKQSFLFLFLLLTTSNPVV